MILVKHLAQEPLHRTCSVRVIPHPAYFSLYTLVISAMFLSLYMMIFYNHHTYNDATNILSFQGDMHYSPTADQALRKAFDAHHLI